MPSTIRRTRPRIRAFAIASYGTALTLAGAWAAPAAAAPRSEIVPVKVIGGLHQAVAFTFAPDGGIWFVEKAEGNVRVFDPATGQLDVFFHLPDVAAEAEQGLVGIELDPRFPDRPYIYLYATRLLEGTLRDQLLRVTDRGGRGTGLRVLWDTAASSGHQHSGGRLLFGPDDALFVTVGDALDPAAAQDPHSERGKILRVISLGRPASGNPSDGSRVYASGIRNSFGLALDPQTGDLWETENGPDCNDEVNRIEPGSNYGWGANGECREDPDPLSTNVDGSDPVPPQLSFTPTIAPTGIAFCGGCGLGRRSEGAIFFGDYNQGDIHRATLDDARERIVEEHVVAHAPDLALSFEVGPDGAIYFSSYIAIFRLELRGGAASSSASASPSVTPSPISGSPRVSPGRRDSNGEGFTLVAVASMALLISGAVVLVAVRRRARSGRHRPTGR